MMRALMCVAALFSIASGAAMAQATPAPQLFRVVGPQDEVTIGLTAEEFEALGSVPGVERLARKLAADGQLIAWLYTVRRAPDGTTRLASTGRVAIMGSNALRIEPYRPALPVASPPVAQ